MKTYSRYIIAAILLFSLGLIIYGFTIIEEDPLNANKCIGFGTVGIFLVAMPLFLITESRGKKMKDYMLTEENIRKMQGKKNKQSEDQ
ncbi:hypothetical protein [Zeaxanthinibacter enoshimensis]|uniref:Uncharacterized protein n=1 Tax=Zeaxanthinibacter enoshimensis TaxID=392009 RepID=A0A4R6TMC6_9FLAO|nr:hypothetical protein [Zeaxanthinibacter enoshimensis]TDQ32594.1 hypothetical protein CLV82_0427 [Zeaxanthinibacter enoshimensis]